MALKTLTAQVPNPMQVPGFSAPFTQFVEALATQDVRAMREVLRALRAAKRRL